MSQICGGGKLYFLPRLPDGSLGPAQFLGPAGPLTLHAEGAPAVSDFFAFAGRSATATFTKTMSLHERKQFRKWIYGPMAVVEKPSGGEKSRWFNRRRLARMSRRIR